MSQSPLPPDDAPPPDLRFIRRLVVVLTSVMIVGLILILGLLVTRLVRVPVPFALPDGITLPEGVRASAVTLSAARVLVLTTGDEVLVYDRASAALLGRMAIDGAR